MSDNKKNVKKAINDIDVKKDVENSKKMRQIVIETDGTNINIAKNETSGNLEFIAVLQSLVVFLQNHKK